MEKKAPSYGNVITSSSVFIKHWYRGISSYSSKHSHHASADVAQRQQKQLLSLSCPFLCSCYCHHLPPPTQPSPHLLHFSCNHVAMQMLCSERFMLPSPGRHEPLSWPPRGGRRGCHYCYHSQAQSLHCHSAPPTHKVLDDFTKTSNFSRTTFIMTNRNQSFQPMRTAPESVCLFGSQKKGIFFP